MAARYEAIPINDVGLIESIPRDRNPQTILRRVVLFIVFAVYCFCCDQVSQYDHVGSTDKIKIQERLHFFVQGASVLTILGLGDITKRAFLFFEECHHRQSRHHGSWKETIRFVFFKKSFVSWIMVVGGFLICLSLIALSEEPIIHLFNFKLLGLNWLCTILASTEIGPNTVEQSTILEQSMLNIGQGLAWSYYFGYLKILARPSDGQPSVRERIRLYEETHHVTVQVKKLIILIPESCNVPPMLARDGDDDLQPAQQLEPLQVNRAGIQNRHYNNSVYEIRQGGEMHLRCAAEMATPVLTLWQMAEQGAAATGLSREEKHQQMLLFCKTLEYIINEDAQCKDSVQLHPFADLDERNNFRPLSSVLREIVETEMARMARAAL